MTIKHKSAQDYPKGSGHDEGRSLIWGLKGLNDSTYFNIVLEYSTVPRMPNTVPRKLTVMNWYLY